ncbi:hypothetical protein [Halegenticoccus soli]|uniref:hypothetical protein n=1 Tax=Halegenticoccus soli TaxID=1985678 RepID=UPI001304709C|nr:hypothetical protein [Halegenticoccus soli]
MPVIPVLRRVKPHDSVELTLDTGDTVAARVTDVDRARDERIRVGLASPRFDGRLRVTATRGFGEWRPAYLQRNALAEPAEEWSPVGEVVEAEIVGTAPA